LEAELILLVLFLNLEAQSFLSCFSSGWRRYCLAENLCKYHTYTKVL